MIENFFTNYKKIQKPKSPFLNIATRPILTLILLTRDQLSEKTNPLGKKREYPKPVRERLGGGRGVIGGGRSGRVRRKAKSEREL